jgi:hypothetical protein
LDFDRGLAGNHAPWKKMLRRDRAVTETPMKQVQYGELSP